MNKSGQMNKSQGGGKNKKGKGKDSQTNEYDKIVEATKIARGKHSKIRKMKQKYGDQDEEERKRKMDLIGAKDVTGFSLTKHQEYKVGKLINQEDKIEENQDGED